MTEETDERLTQYQHSCLCAASDWIAPFEAVSVLYPGGSSKRERTAVEKALKTLRDKYMVHYSAANNTYRITDRGRAYLTRKDSRP